MTTRRELRENAAGALAGIASVDCGVMAAAPAPAPAPRREVVVNGRRVTVVDVHAHCAVSEAMALMGVTLAPPLLPPVLDMAQAPEDLAGRSGRSRRALPQARRGLG